MRAGFHASSIERVNQEEEGRSGSDLVEAVYGAVLLCVAAGQVEVVLVGQIAVHVVAVATEHLVRRDCSTQPHSSLVLNTHTVLWKFRRREKRKVEESEIKDVSVFKILYLWREKFYFQTRKQND